MLQPKPTPPEPTKLSMNPKRELTFLQRILPIVDRYRPNGGDQ